MNFRFTTAAIEELEEAVSYLDSNVPGMGIDFLQEVESAIQQVLLSPRLGESCLATVGAI